MLGINYKLRGRWFPFFWFGIKAIAIKPVIYIRRDIWDILTDTGRIGILTHEQTHINQQKNYRLIVYICKYLFNRQFRLTCEINAVIQEFKYYKSMNNEITDSMLYEVAIVLSSGMYLWAGNTQEIYERLQREFANV